MTYRRARARASRRSSGRGSPDIDFITVKAKNKRRRPSTRRVKY